MTAGGGMDAWAELDRPAPERVMLGGVELAKGSRVRLVPRAGADVFDVILAGKVGIIEGIDQDHENTIHLAVVLEDDPGRDLGDARHPGHRFFFGLDEVEPLAPARTAEPRATRVLVAGIGNIFLGDDGFGVEVVRQLAERTLPPGVDVVDFGIRGLDLAYALQDDYDAAILVDAAPRGGIPGTLYVIEPDLHAADGVGPPDAHGMDPVRVLRLARDVGRTPPRMLLVACEPCSLVPEERHDDLLVELSGPVRAAVAEAVELVESLIGELGAAGRRPATPASESERTPR